MQTFGKGRNGKDKSDPMTDIAVSPELQKKIQEIRYMDYRIGEFILARDDVGNLLYDALADGVSRSLAEDDIDVSYDVVTGLCRSGAEPQNDSELSALYLIYARISDDLGNFPWNISDVRRACSYILGTDIIIVREGESELIDFVNTSPYDPLVTASVFYNEISQYMSVREASTLLHKLLYATGLGNIGMCKVDAALFEHVPEDSSVQDTLEHLISILHDAYFEAIVYCAERDITGDLDGNEISFVRHSRIRSGTFTIQDASLWAGNLEDQSVRAKLTGLAEKGILHKEGRTRAVRFRYSDPFGSLRDEANIAVRSEFSVENGK